MGSSNDSEQDWKRARDLFLECVELEPPAREARLERLEREDPPLAAWVRRLLARDSGSSEAAMPQRCGPYALLRRIGSGGMGDVFLARRVDGEYERDVAVKLQRRSVANELVARRFQRERQTLAQLDHEYIARLYDGGTTEEGEPYLVLEYVDGVALDAYCAREDLGLRERLELFLRVLAAVAHAHARGVVHRDLKPSNVLVRADGTPRLLDFGIARPREDATPGGALTRTGQRLFTPEYASPEQVQGREVSPASDVFALGVLLYQLLCGEKPWDAGLSQHELERAIVETDPAPPSRRLRGTARRGLAGDLDTIVLKCLAKEPERRYPDASALAADLELHVRGFPIRARRTSLAQRAWRYGRRKPWLALACIAGLVAAVAGGAAWRAHAASATSQAALLDALRARIEGARGLRDRGQLPEAETALREVLAALDAYPDERAMRAEVHVQLAVLANHASKPRDALERLREARALLDPRRELAPRTWASWLNARAYALARAGTADQAWQAAQDAFAHAEQHVEHVGDLWIDAVQELIEQRMKRGESTEALATVDTAILGRRSRAGERDLVLAQLLNSRAVALHRSARSAEALEPAEEALEIYGWHYGDKHPQVAKLRANRAEMAFAAGRPDLASSEYAKAVEAYRDLEHHQSELANVLARQGEIAHAQGELVRAIELFRECDALIEAKLGAFHPGRRRAAAYLGTALAEFGDLARAREALEFSLESVHGVAAYGAAVEADARVELGRVLVQMGERDAGRAQFARALALRERELGPEHAATCAVRALLDE